VGRVVVGGGWNLVLHTNTHSHSVMVVWQSALLCEGSSSFSLSTLLCQKDIPHVLNNFDVECRIHSCCTTARLLRKAVSMSDRIFCGIMLYLSGWHFSEQFRGLTFHPRIVDELPRFVPSMNFHRWSVS
jgi:hypothetical protein